MNRQLPSRNNVDPATTWDVGSVFPDRASWEAVVEAVEAALPSLAAHASKLANGSASLLACIDDIEALSKKFERAYLYASMFAAVDATDQDGLAMVDRMRVLGARFAAATAFYDPAVLGIGAATLADWVAEETGLAPHAHNFDRLERRRPHVRSGEVEAIFGELTDPLRTTTSAHSILANAELRFAPAVGTDGATHEVAQGTIGALVTHPDRAVRRSAYESYADAHLGFKRTMAALQAAGVKGDAFMAAQRGYPSSIEAALGRTHIPRAVFDQLIEAFRANLPTWHRYFRWRRTVLGLDELRPYDIKAPLTTAPPVVPYRQAVEWIIEGMRPLGDDYVAVMAEGLTTGRWVDIYPNVGKRSGAFSTGAYDTHPFIFMSYNDDLFSLSTLAHEIGHSMHSYYSRRDQPYATARYGLFAAEVASNFNQALVRGWLLEHQPDPLFQLALLEEAFSNFHRYFFIMPTLARFELALHERAERGAALNADVMNGLLADLYEEGYGGEVVVDREREGITWAEFHTHLYSNFYVYQYATGISAANALAHRVLGGAPGAVGAYRRFLSAGGSDYPLPLLARAGVDMASREPVDVAFGVLSAMVDRVATLVPGVPVFSAATPPG
ncbi:MAG: oligoendopeptidase F [Ardenticatenales bacterium]